MEREELDENNVRKAMRVLDGCGGAKQTVLVCMHAPVQMCLPTSVPAHRLSCLKLT